MLFLSYQTHFTPFKRNSKMFPNTFTFNMDFYVLNISINDNFNMFTNNVIN